MITGLTHPGITTSNLENWLAFIRNNLGACHIQSQVSDQDYLSQVTGLNMAKLKIGFVKFGVDSFPLEVIEYIHPIGSRQNHQYGCVGYSHIGFVSDEIHALRNNCIVNNLEVSEIHHEEHACWGKYQSFRITAPDGIPIKIISSKQNAGHLSPVRVHHTGLTVSDLEAAKQLLEKNLGLVEITRGRQREDILCNEFDTEYEFVMLMIPNHDFMIELRKFPFKACGLVDMGHQHPGCLHHCFQVDDIFKDYETLKKAGVEFVGQPAQVTAGVNKGAYAIYFHGFDGYRFEIFQKP
jgi:catechol 2,3-dioxygenase-like lactoylglutathione lyase family enzyme